MDLHGVTFDWSNPWHKPPDRVVLRIKWKRRKQHKLFRVATGEKKWDIHEVHKSGERYRQCYS